MNLYDLLRAGINPAETDQQETSVEVEESAAPQEAVPVKPVAVQAAGNQNVARTLRAMLHNNMGRKAAIAAVEILGEPVSKRRKA